MDLSKIKITDLQKLIDIRKEKYNIIRLQKYNEAARLRDLEKTIIDRTGLDLSGYDKYDLEELIIEARDRKIDDLLDGN